MGFVILFVLIVILACNGAWPLAAVLAAGAIFILAVN